MFATAAGPYNYVLAAPHVARTACRMDHGSKMQWLARLTALVGAVAAIVYAYYSQYRPDPSSYPVHGIDVSHHQGPIRWSEVASSGGVQFAYIKATEGADCRDSRFLENWTAAEAAGVRRGAYHFYTFCRPAVAQARNFTDRVPREAGALAPALDLEFGGNCNARPAREAARAELTAYSDAMLTAYGSRPVLYVTDEFLSTYGDVLPAHSGLWIRSIAWAPRSRLGWVYWQFHNRGHVQGIDRPVDLNVFNGSLADFQKLTAIIH